MKRVLIALMLAVAFAGLASCQKAKSSTRVSTGTRSGGLAASATSTSSGVSLSAAVKSTSSQSDFDLAVQDIVEATMPRDYVGHVDATASDGTGVFLGGKVTSSSGGAINFSNGSTSISSNSELLFVIYDSFYTESGLDPIPPIYLKQSSGTVSNSYADIKFWDSYGYIRLVGELDNNKFYADVYYETTKTYDGKAGWSGRLGRAEIPTCSFFRCN